MVLCSVCCGLLSVNILTSSWVKSLAPVQMRQPWRICVSGWILFNKSRWYCYDTNKAEQNCEHILRVILHLLKAHDRNTIWPWRVATGQAAGKLAQSGTTTGRISLGKTSLPDVSISLGDTRHGLHSDVAVHWRHSSSVMTSWYGKAFL